MYCRTVRMVSRWCNIKSRSWNVTPTAGCQKSSRHTRSARLGHFHSAAWEYEALSPSTEWKNGGIVGVPDVASGGNCGIFPSETRARLYVAVVF
jgi:hypothetical protein